MTPPLHCGRFAPSPTGPLHTGSLLAAFAGWLFVRRAGGRWLVRIEDVDPPRTVPGAAQAQLRVLDQFGLGSDAPVLWQSQRGAVYQRALEALLASGEAFICHCSRTDLAANNGIHHRCVSSQPRPDPAVRLRVAPGSTVTFNDTVRGPQQQDVHAQVGDFVLRRADGCWAYQLAVVVDDAAQGVTDVVRGADLLASTARQVLLQRALGLHTPRYAHLPLLLGTDGRKLSKSCAALPVDTGDPVAVLRHLWRLLGQASEAIADATDRDDLLRRAASAFDAGRIPDHDILLS